MIERFDELVLKEREARRVDTTYVAHPMSHKHR